MGFIWMEKVFTPWKYKIETESHTTNQFSFYWFFFFFFWFWIWIFYSFFSFRFFFKFMYFHFNICIFLSLQELMIYLTKKLNQELIIFMTFGQFDHLVILNKSIWTCPTWLVVFFIDHKMGFLTSQIAQKFKQPKKINLKNNLICKYKNVNNKYLPTCHPWPTYLSTAHLNTIHLHTCTRYIYKYTHST